MGTAFLVAIVVGSGIYAQRLSPHNIGLQLLENSIATGAGLVALILALGPVSGAHFNPIVTLADRILGGINTRDAGVYVVVQIVGACVGAIVANLMFDLPAVTLSTHTRSSSGLWLGEVVAAFGLILVILGVVRSGRASARRVRGRWLHRRRVLVHLLDQLRQPCRHDRPHRSPTRSPASRRAASRVHRLPDLGGAHRRGTRPLPEPARPRRRPGRPPRPTTTERRSSHDEAASKARPTTGPDRAVPLRPQRRPFPDGARLVQPPRRRPRHRLVRRLRARGRSEPVGHRSMAEVGIDITDEFPKPWTDEIVRAADVVITMGCGDACPLFPGKRYEDWVLEDPAGQGSTRYADPRRDPRPGRTAPH